MFAFFFLNPSRLQSSALPVALGSQHTQCQARIKLTPHLFFILGLDGLWGGLLGIVEQECDRFQVGVP